MVHEYRIAIIGAGAAGGMCAYLLSKSGLDITLFDKSKPLLTLLPTGGGRCNLAHAEYDFKGLAKNYPRGEKFLYSIFSRFSTQDTIDLFSAIGVDTYTQDDGRIFPKSNSAKDVREKLLEKINVKTENENIINIKQCDNEYKIITNKAQYLFSHVIIAIGGHSELNILKNLNINIIPQKPSLVGLNTEEKFNDLSGTIVKNCCSDGIHGDILFTHFGVSGPLIYKISSINAFKDFPYEKTIDLYPKDFDLQEMMNLNPHKEIKNILAEILPQKVAKYLLKDFNETEKACNINGKTRDIIIEKIHNFKITITDTNKGEETVTAGGIDLNEINSKTMEFKKYPHLYAIGEVLDIDGFCGGFNLQNAWSTAFVASESILSD